MYILCSILYKIRYLFYIFSTSQFGLAMFELCNNYMWLVVTLRYPNLSQNFLSQERCSHSEISMECH